MAEKAKVWCILTKDGRDRVWREDHWGQLLEEFDVTVNDGDQMPTPEELAANIGQYDVLAGGWGTPQLTKEVFDNASRLKLYCHSAGSVKGVLAQDVVDEILLPRNIVTFSANEAIGYNVAESAVGMMIMVSHGWIPFINDFRQTGRWRNSEYRWNHQFLQGARVGVVAASKVGRHVIHLLANWDLDILVFDPYLSADEAAKLGVTKVELDELFAESDIITIHTPMIPETDDMIGAAQLKLMKDGATLVNTARGNVIDHDALYEEAKTGRIFVCLDVTTPEPLQQDSKFRLLNNVYITPHISGAGYYGYFKIGEMSLQAIRDCLAGRPVNGAVPYERYAQLA